MNQMENISERILQRMHTSQSQPRPKPNKTVVYIFMVLVFLGMAYFVYNWWRCRQNRILEQENDEDFEPEEYGFEAEDLKGK